MPANGVLPPAVLVLNDKYLPASHTTAARVGATSFALDAVECFRKAEIFAGLILYRRQEGLAAPTLHPTVRNGMPCMEMSFNFHMDHARVRSAMAGAARRLASVMPAAKPPMLYYQTDTLLRFHPSSLVACVTHHGPFFHDFADHFSVDAALRAFESAGKARHIMRQQELGLSELVAQHNIFVIQHSRMQRDYLLKRGVDPQRVREVSPPVDPGKLSGESVPRKLRPFIESSRFLLCTAVARLDYFKNVDLLISAGIALMERGVPVNVLVIGGDDVDDVPRKSLLREVPPRFADRFLAVSKLAKGELYSIFRMARHRSVFVCTSRYETLGITPLEAALSGVWTIVPDSPLIEAARFFPPDAKFQATVAGLVKAIERLSPADVRGRGEALRSLMEKQISIPSFERDLIQAWRTFSVRECASGVPRR